MVSKYPILEPSSHPRLEPRFTNRCDSQLTAGLLAEVSQRPTNQSKLTGKCSRPKCSRCHTYPARSRPKEKGTHKLRPCDVSNNRLVSWRVVGSNPRLKFAGFSASGVLDHLDREYYDMEDDDYVDEVYEESSCELAFNGSLELEIASVVANIKDGDVGVEDMGFYDEEIVWPDEEDGDWDCCLAVEKYL